MPKSGWMLHTCRIDLGDLVSISLSKSIASDLLYKHISNLLSLNQANDVQIRFDENHCSNTFFPFLSWCYVWVLLLQKIPKGNIFAVCQPKKAEKNVQIFLEKKNAVASRLMYPIWWNDKLKKFACVCMGVLFFSLLF